MVRCQLVLSYSIVTGKYLTIKIPTSIWKEDAHVPECPNTKDFQIRLDYTSDLVY